MKIKIGCLTYDVVDIPVQEADQRKLYGNCDSDKQLIRLDPRMGKERRKEVFLHEILHAITSQYLYNPAKATEEEIVTQLAYGFSAVMKDNPSLKKVLF